MPYQTLLSGQVFTFDSVKEVLAKANVRNSLPCFYVTANTSCRNRKDEGCRGGEPQPVLPFPLFYHRVDFLQRFLFLLHRTPLLH